MEPVIVAGAVATTASLVIASTAWRSVALTDPSVTVMVSALLPFASVRVVRVDKSPSVTVAVITPVVSPSSVFT